MNADDPVAEGLAPQAADLHLLQLEELLRRPEELPDDVEPVDEAVEPAEDQVLLFETRSIGMILPTNKPSLETFGPFL